VPAKVTGTLQLSLEDLPDALRARFISDLEATKGSTVYLVKFDKNEGNNQHGLKLLRGATVESTASKSEDLSTVTLEVALDGAQYRMDMLRLAVEDSMFVEESYAACQAVVKMPSVGTIDQLKALIDLVQGKPAQMPSWLRETLLCHTPTAELHQVEEVANTERIVWCERRD
jgi:hypothetical protein